MWRPIEEFQYPDKVPYMDGPVAIICGTMYGSSKRLVGQAEWDGVAWWVNASYHFDTVTHWMPLPEPPEE